MAVIVISQKHDARRMEELKKEIILTQEALKYYE